MCGTNVVHGTTDGKGWMRVNRLGFVCVMLLANACTPRDEAPPSTGPDTTAASASPFLRGIAVRNADTPRFVACGATDSLRLIDPGSALSGVRVDGDARFVVMTATESGDSAVLVQRVLYASADRGECYNDWSGFEYRATGTAPGWVAEIRGASARLRRQGDVNDEWNGVRKDSTEGRIRFAAPATPGAEGFELVLESRPCAGSGTWSAWTAHARVGPHTLRGCAVPGS